MPKYLKPGTSLILLLSLFLTEIALAIPARPLPITIEQPDGTFFTAISRGDEFMRILTTEGGAAIIKGEDGFYYYATYDAEGHKVSTEYRIGDSVPGNIIEAAKNIPTSILKRRGTEIRQTRDKAFYPIVGTRSSDKGHMREPIRHRNILIILAEFADTPFTFSKEDFQNMMNQKGWDGYGCAREYMNDQFLGKCTFDIDVSNIIQLPDNMKYYGANNYDNQDLRPQQMVIDACRAADSSIDFSKYDNDGDGYIDNVFVYFSGYNEAESGNTDCIWPHAWDLKEDSYVKLDNKILSSYACTSELRGAPTDTDLKMATIGTFCHEYSHTLGLKDLYDTDSVGEGGFIAAATWQKTSLMDGGNYNCEGKCPPNYNSLERWMLGITPMKVLGEGRHRIEPVHRSKASLCIESDKVSEFFLIEYRDNTKWDQFIGGKGILAYHIDLSDNDSGTSMLTGRNLSARERWIENEVNGNWAHQCCDLIEADGREDKFKTDLHKIADMDIKGVYFPTGEINSIAPESNNALKGWSGNAIPYKITEMTDKGTHASLNIINFDTGEPAYTKILQSCIFEDSIYLRWTAGKYSGEKALLQCYQGSKLICQREIISKTGIWETVIDGLQEKQEYVLEIMFTRDGQEGRPAKLRFTTRQSSAHMPAAIMTTPNHRVNTSTLPIGTQIPLKVLNCPDAVASKWYFDEYLISDSSAKVEEGQRLFYEVIRDGILKAIVEKRDGSTLIVQKQIKVKGTQQDYIVSNK